MIILYYRIVVDACFLFDFNIVKITYNLTTFCFNSFGIVGTDTSRYTHELLILPYYNYEKTHFKILNGLQI